MSRMVLVWFLLTVFVTLFSYCVDRVMKKEIGKWSFRFSMAGIATATAFATIIFLERI